MDAKGRDSDLQFMDTVQEVRRERSARTRRRLMEAVVRGVILSGDGGYQPFYGGATVEHDGLGGVEVTPLHRGELDDTEKVTDTEIAKYWERELLPRLAFEVAQWWDDADCEHVSDCEHGRMEAEFLDLFVRAWEYSCTDKQARP